MHKMIRINPKKLAARFNKIQLLLCLPQICASFALLIIVNVVMNVTAPLVQMYRGIFYIVFFLCLYSFLVSLIISVQSTKSLKGHKSYTYIEITNEYIIFSQHEKSVKNGKKNIEYIKLGVMKLSSVTDAYCEHGKIIAKGSARLYCQRADWLCYDVSKSGKIFFERPWNDDFGGTPAAKISITDNFTFGERIAKRILLCAQRGKIDEERREEFRKRMLSIAGKIEKRKGLTQKYKEPPVKLPREGIKERKW